MIGETEDVILSALKAAFGARVKLVESLPADLDAWLARRNAVYPAVLVAFAGGGAEDRGDSIPGIAARWAVYCVTAHAQGEQAQRRGDVRVLGALTMIEVVIPTLHGLDTPAGSLSLVGVQNLFGPETGQRGITIYAATFGQNLRFDAAPEGLLEGLPDFAGLDVEWDLAPADEAPEATDQVALEVEE